MYGLGPIGMPREFFRERVAAAALRGDPAAAAMMHAIDGAPRGRGRAPPRPTSRHPASVPKPPVDEGFACLCAAVRDGVSRRGGVGVVPVARDIGDGVTSGCQPARFAKHIAAAKAVGARALLLDVNSTGGSIDAGFRMIATIAAARASTPVIAYVRKADSMASAVALSGDFVVIDPRGSFRLHDPSGASPSALAAYRDRLLAVYTARTFMSRALADGYMSGDVRIDAQSAYVEGLADEIGDASRAEDLARAATTTAGLWSAPLRDSWRRHILRERAADAAGVVPQKG